LRIDPVVRAFVSLSRIAIIREEDEALLYSAECLADFAKLELSARLLKHEVGQHLYCLPQTPIPKFIYRHRGPGEDPYRLELTLQVQSATQGAVERQHKALAEQSKLSALLEAGLREQSKLSALLKRHKGR